MARGKKRQTAPITDIEEKARPTDEELFIEVSDKPFWEAKKLSPRRAVRFHNWLNDVLADMTSAISSIDLKDLSSTDWSNIIGKVVSILGEKNYFELLSLASGHTKQEIEANEEKFDYYEAWQCVADFVEINRLGSVVTNFFLPVITTLAPKGQEEQPPA